MHQVIVESLEEYLTGTLAPAARRDFEAHLETCHDCRREVHGMTEVSGLFASLRSSAALEPPPGFYARLMADVGNRRAASFWSTFSLDAAFGRRVVFASLLTLAVLGSVLVSRETSYSPGPASPESVMAADQDTNRDAMLVTLTSYEP
jgi:anti-sigma factor RsiW